MRCPLTGRTLLASALLSSSLALAGCADDGPTSPATPRAPRTPVPLASTSSDTDGATVTLWDDYGTGYTLDPVRSEIRVTNGYVIELTSDELADALNAFQAAHESDRAANTFAYAASPTDPYCDLGREMCEWHLDYSLGAPGTAPLPGDGAGVVAPPAAGFVFARATAGELAPSLPGPDGGAGPLYPTYWSCADIATAIYDATARHRTTRRNITSVLAGAITLRASVQDGQLRFNLASLSGIAWKLELAAYDQVTSSTQLSILASLYNAYGCWGSPWGSAGVNTATMRLTPTVEKVCHTETWMMHRDGEESYIWVNVQVCEYLPF